MTRTFASAVMLVCIAAAPAVAADEPGDGPLPLAVLIQTDPWAMVLGADTPRVAIYEGGEVIFVKKIGDAVSYHHFRLRGDRQKELGDQIQRLLGVRELRGAYDIAPGVTDQPTALFYVRSGTHEAATQVYGLMTPGTELPAFTRFGGDFKPDVLPDALGALHRFLVALDDPASREWIPSSIEVMLWDYSHAPEASIRWPQEWPGLQSQRARRRGESYSIFLDGSELSKLSAFLATRNPRGAVEIEGRKMSAEYRFVFPRQEVWTRALERAVRRELESEKRPGN